MPIRYYANDIIGAGTRADPYRHRASAHGVVSAFGPLRLVGGVPSPTWTLVRVDAADHSALLADPQMAVFPDLARDQQWSLGALSERTALATWLTARGANTTVIVNTALFGNVLDAVTKQNEPAFSTWLQHE